MTRIITPHAPARGGRAAQLRVEPSQLGSAVAQVGQSVLQLGERLEADTLRTQSTQARIDMQSALSEARLEFDQLSPEAADQQWGPRMQELRAEHVDRVDPKIQEDVGFAFDDLSNRHAAGLGRQGMAVRQGRARVQLDEYQRGIEQSAPAMDQDTELAMLEQYADSLADAVNQGILTPEQASDQMLRTQQTVQQTRALRLLDTDPASLVQSIDEGAYNLIDPPQVESLRARARSAIAQQNSATERELERQEKERETAVGDELRTMRDVAREGRTYAPEATLMADPSVQSHPDFQEAADAIALRDASPEFATLTPKQQSAAIEAERARSVTAKHETRLLDEMERVHTAATEAWQEDPIGRAAEVFARAEGAKAPPALPDFATADPAEFAVALAERRRYGQSLQQSGYTDELVLFTPEERTALGAIAKTTTDPDQRMRLAASMRNALGADAGRAFREIEADPVFAHMGGMLATGGRVAVVEEAFIGQQALDAGNVKLPPVADRLVEIDALLGDMAGGRDQMVAQIRQSADALFAARARGTDPDEAPDLYAQAVQDVLGASVGRDGQQRGGVQEIRGSMTPLPMDLSGGALEDVLDNAAALLDGRRTGGSRVTPSTLEVTPEQGMALWTGAALRQEGGRFVASEAVPHFGGAPLDANRAEDIRLRAIAPDVYAAFVEVRGQPFDVTDAEGRPWFLRLSTLREGASP